MSVKRAFRFRFYQTAEQDQPLAQQFGCVVFVYNQKLDRRQQRHRDGPKSNYADDVAVLTALKHKPGCIWLRDVSVVALKRRCVTSTPHYRIFFAWRAGFPRFKRKRAAQSYSLMRNGFTLRGGQVRLAKMSAPLDVRWSRQLPATPSSLTVSRDAAGRYFVSLLCDAEEAGLPVTNKVMAADLGLRHFLTFADDQPPLSPPRFLAELLHRVRRLSRARSRKHKGSKNRDKACERLARLHARIADARKGFLHKLSTQLTREKTRRCSWRTCASRG